MKTLGALRLAAWNQRRRVISPVSWPARGSTCMHSEAQQGESAWTTYTWLATQQPTSGRFRCTALRTSSCLVARPVCMFVCVSPARRCSEPVAQDGSPAGHNCPLAVVMVYLCCSVHAHACLPVTVAPAVADFAAGLSRSCSH